jgi:D-glycero-alpha-D-manno-heptose 1-phosphate guanylyltransferase
VLNGDSLALANLAPAAAMLAEPATQGVIVGVSVPDASRYGQVTADKCLRLLRFDEKRPGAGVINAGVYLLKPSVTTRFPGQRPLSFENEVFPKLLAEGMQLKVCVTDAPFLDIGTPESLAQAGAFIQQNLQSLETT